MDRKWVIADIHGCFETLRSLVEKQIHPAKDDLLYFLGDYIDRGPKSKDVIDYLMQLKADGYQLRTLMGNHEECMLQAYDDDHRSKKTLFFTRPSNPSKETWYRFGGRETMQSFGTEDMKAIPEQYIQWLRNLEQYIEEDAFLLAHAGFNFGNENIFSDENAIRWIRDFEVDLGKSGGRKVIHGHVPVSLEVISQCITGNRFNFIDLDNGCVYRDRPGLGNLVALELNSMQLLVQKNIEKI